MARSLAGREFIAGSSFTIADMSAWGWLIRASRVLKGATDPFAAFPEIKRWFAAIDSRPAVARAMAVGKDHVTRRRNAPCSRRTIRRRLED